MYGLWMHVRFVWATNVHWTLWSREHYENFQTRSVDVVQECQTTFNFRTVSELILERKRKFLQKLCSCENGICQVLAFMATGEPSSLCASLKAGTHYPCSRAVFTGRVHGPWTRASNFWHPCSRPVFTGDILTPVWYYWSPWTRPVNTGRVALKQRYDVSMTWWR